MRSSLTSFLWRTAAWGAIIGAPAAALGFVCQVTRFSCCWKSKQECLHDAVDGAWFVLGCRLAVIAGLCGLLWVTRRFAAVACRDAFALVAAGWSALLAILVTGSLLVGLKAVIEGATDVRAELLTPALLALPVAALSWQALLRWLGAPPRARAPNDG